MIQRNLQLGLTKRPGTLAGDWESGPLLWGNVCNYSGVNVTQMVAQMQNGLGLAFMWLCISQAPSPGVFIFNPVVLGALSKGCL